MSIKTISSNQKTIIQVTNNNPPQISDNQVPKLVPKIFDIECVEVLFDFCYTTELGRQVFMKRGDKFQLIRKTNDDWWQVKRVTKHYMTNGVMIKRKKDNSGSSESMDVIESSDELDDSDPEDELSHPFYAPSNYLREIGPTEKRVNDGGIYFTKVIGHDCEYSCDDSADEVDSGNQDDGEISSNAGITSSKESLIDETTEDKKPKAICDNKDDKRELKKSTKNILSKQDGPIYSNLKNITNNKSPIVPAVGTVPIRILLDHWAEYLDCNGRKFYYNSISRETSWKPPRKGTMHNMSFNDDENSSHSEENLAGSSRRNQTNHDLITKSLSISAKPKTKPRKVDMPQQHTPPSLPKGWTRRFNEDAKEIFFVNDNTKGKWFCKLDDNGRLYFFEENGKECYWELPDLSSNEDEEAQSLPSLQDKEAQLSTDTSSKENSPEAKGGSLPRVSKGGRFVPTPTLPQSHRLMALDRSIKARSMAFLPTSDRQTFGPIIPDALLIQHRNQVKKSQYKPTEPPSTLEEAKPLKIGIMNRTKLMEAGRRVRKNWNQSLVAISQDYLLFFKEGKSNSKPEIVIELVGALIEWTPGKSSRKNVFQVTTIISGQQILIQDDCPLKCKEWHDAIKSAILKLPSFSTEKQLQVKDIEKKECKLKRSKSSKQYRKRDESPDKEETLNQVLENIPPEKKKKIRERLRQFLRRRPTLESLREKGIFKDEPVFGCNLNNLCTREKQTVPKFVQQIVKAIEHKDMTADGIYRACGNLSQVQKLRFQVNHDNYAGIWSEEDVHVLTGALKLFFRDMKEPLFPCDRFDALMEAIALPERSQKLEALSKIVNQLPRFNQESLKFLLQHLLRVKDYSDENKMHIRNLAIVFGPTLMWPQIDSNNFAYDMMLRMKSNEIIEFLLLEHSNLFPKD